jgi:hypothetical protein
MQFALHYRRATHGFRSGGVGSISKPILFCLRATSLAHNCKTEGGMVAHDAIVGRVLKSFRWARQTGTSQATAPPPRSSG